MRKKYTIPVDHLSSSPPPTPTPMHTPPLKPNKATPTSLWIRNIWISTSRQAESLATGIWSSLATSTRSFLSMLHRLATFLWNLLQKPWLILLLTQIALALAYSYRGWACRSHILSNIIGEAICEPYKTTWEFDSNELWYNHREGFVSTSEIEPLPLISTPGEKISKCMKSLGGIANRHMRMRKASNLLRQTKNFDSEVIRLVNRNHFSPMPELDEELSNFHNDTKKNVPAFAQFDSALSNLLHWVHTSTTVLASKLRSLERTRQREYVRQANTHPLR